MKKIKDYILQQVSQQNLAAAQAAELLKEVLQIENKMSVPTPQSHQEFAVIGMACRFPQAHNVHQYWQNLLLRKDAVGPFPQNRMEDVKRVSKRTYAEFSGLHCRIGTYFERVDLFDHTFFGLTPAEVRVMDPGQRIFLEVAVEAIEDAGLTREALKKSSTGVYVGFSVSEDPYMDILTKDDPNVALGNQPAMLAYRLAFLYDLRGPTMIIDTACSASLVAVHQACQAIAQGDCEQALVGGVNVRTFPAVRDIANLGIEAYDGKCRAFDEKASGTNIGDGVAAIFIKTRAAAERDGDYIHGIIKGSAVNSDGSSNGLTAPNPEAQAHVLIKAWENAQINPENLNFIEAHGTGTKLGDPIEISGLSYAFANFTSKKQFCALGAVKTNIGHLEATSGLAGLIKAILCLKHRQLPPNIHFHKPNPFIDFNNSPVFVNNTLKKWEADAGQLLGAVSSFGISGTNCHMVVEEYQKPRQIQDPQDAPAALEAKVLLLSAKNEEALMQLVSKYLDYLRSNPLFSLQDICYSSLVARDHYDCRLAFLVTSKEELAERITALLQSYKKGESLPLMPKQVYYSNVRKNPTWMPAAEYTNSLFSNEMDLLHAYFNAQAIAPQAFYPAAQARKVPLPTYAFNPIRHWPKLEIEEDAVVQSRLPRIFHTINWVEEAASGLQTISQSPGLHLFLMHAREEHRHIYDFALAQSIACIQVYPGKKWEQIDAHTYIIDPQDPAHYARLLEKTTSHGQSIDGIVHLWDCLPVGDAMHSFEKLEQSQILGTFGTYHLVRALAAIQADKPCKLVSITAYAHRVSGHEIDIDPARMPSLGINKVASQEFPKMQSVALDIDMHHFDPQETPKQIFSEIFNAAGYKDAVVAYRQQKRYVQILQREIIEDLEDRAPLIKEGGVYIITGGLGYLGLQTAMALAKQKNVKIALLGRRDASKITPKQLDSLNAIKQLGSEIVYIQADVTHPDECRKAIQQVSASFGDCHGLFVAIKNISHQRLDEVRFENFSTNILSKLRGVWLLDQLTKHMQPDFMATFSSISSLTGGPTGADCCASNLFLDSYGDYRNMHGKTTITMNYTLIEADDGSLLSDRLSMIPPLTQEEFLACLHICLTKNIPVAVMSYFDSRVMKMVLPFMKVRFSTPMLAEFEAAGDKPLAMPGPQMPGNENRSDNPHLALEDLVSTMQRIWKDVLGYTEIEEQANFFDKGGDSISAVKLIHLTKLQLQIELQVTDLYAYPRLCDLCQHIHEKLSGQSTSQSKDKMLLKQLLDGMDSGAVDLDMAASLI